MTEKYTHEYAQHIIDDWQGMEYKDVMHAAVVYQFIYDVDDLANVAQSSRTLTVEEYAQVIEARNKAMEVEEDRISEEELGDKDVLTKVAAKLKNKEPIPDDIDRDAVQRTVTRMQALIDDSNAETKRYSKVLAKLRELYNERRELDLYGMVNAWKLNYILLNYRTNDSLSDQFRNELDDTNSIEELRTDGKDLESLQVFGQIIENSRKDAAAWWQVLQILAERLGTNSVELLAGSLLTQDTALHRLTRESKLLSNRMTFHKAPEDETASKRTAEFIDFLSKVPKLETVDYSPAEHTIKAAKRDISTASIDDLPGILTRSFVMLKDTATNQGGVFHGE